MDHLFLHFLLRSITGLVFCLLLTHSSRGQSESVDSLQPIIARVGDDVVLPCQIKPSVDVSAATLEWKRSNLFVLVWRSGADFKRQKDPSYRGRTSLFPDELKHGNISLKLSDVKLSDKGTYRCYVVDMNREMFVQLVVAPDTVASPVISLSGMDRDRGGVVLQCESRGWYPEPELLWLDAEGNLLSAGPPETVRGPDDLYTVSSRATVDKRHNNSFTCRVQQKDTHQTKEAHIHVPDDFFSSSSSSADGMMGRTVPVLSIVIGLAVSLAVSIMVILACVLFVWRQNKSKTKKRSRDEAEKKKLLEETKDLTEKYEKIEEELQKTKEELKNKTDEVNELKEEKKKLQEELVTRKKELETRYKEMKEIKDELEKNKPAAFLSSWIPWSSSSNKQKMEEMYELTQKKKKLKKELETRNTELEETKDEEKKKELKEELETRNNEMEEIKKKLKDMERELEENIAAAMPLRSRWIYELREKKKKMKKDLDTRNKEMETTKKEMEKIKDEVNELKEEKKKLEEELETRNKEMETRDKEMETRYKEMETINKEMETRYKEMETRYKEMEEIKDEVKNKLIDMEREVVYSHTFSSEKSNIQLEKNKAAASKSSWFPWSSSSKKKKKMEEVNELKEEKKKLEEELETRNKEMETRNKEMEEIKFELEKNKAAASKSSRFPWQTETSNNQEEEESLMEESERIKPEQTQNSSSSDTQETSGDIEVVVNDDFYFICLTNMSDQDKPLGGRQLKVQINDSEPITYTFDPSMKLKTGEEVTIYRPDYDQGFTTPDTGDLVWSDLKSWMSGDRVQATLQ